MHLIFIQKNLEIFAFLVILTHLNDMINFMNNQCLSNPIKGPTCFKSVNGAMIDLFLTTTKYLFQKTNSFETGISD